MATPTKKTAANKAPARKVPAKKAVAKKTATKKTVAKKTVAKKAPAGSRRPGTATPTEGLAGQATTSRARPVAPGGWVPAAGEAGIRVRMYRVGFGDFFLVSFLGDDGRPLHVIVDCGVFRGTSQTGDIHSIEAAVADMVATTGGTVQLIVMTHRHADHIAGFARCDDDFRRLAVSSVWMPIWESEYEPTAVKFQNELTRTALGLRQHLTALGAKATEAEQTARRFLENATGELAAAAAAAGNGKAGGGGGGSNARALDLLKHGFPGVTPAYLKGNDRAPLPQPLVDAGLACQVLGPPPLDNLDLMKLMDLQKTVGQYLAGAGATVGGEGDDEGPLDPFGTEWHVDLDAAAGDIVGGSAATGYGADPATGYAPESFREWVQEPRKNWEDVTPEEALPARRLMEQAVLASQPQTAVTAAKQLDDFLNNQSLVLLFTFGGKRLLFVGDAQAGNWEHWLFDTDTPDRTGTGPVSPAAGRILSSLDFYKVGHHGSGNATPKAAAEAMGATGHRFVAMCSTEGGVYGTEHPEDPARAGTEVPRGPLLARLGQESALVRSDQIPITVAGTTVPAKAPAPLPPGIPGSRLETGPLWVDCYL